METVSCGLGQLDNASEDGRRVESFLGCYGEMALNFYVTALTVRSHQRSTCSAGKGYAPSSRDARLLFPCETEVASQFLINYAFEIAAGRRSNGIVVRSLARGDS